MPFDIQTYFTTAVAANLEFLREQLLTDPEQADRWLKQNGTILNGIAEGFNFPVVQADAAWLLIDLMPLIERWGFWTDYLPLVEQAAELNLAAEQYGRLHIMLGRIYYLNRNFKDAIHELKVARTLARKQQLETVEAAAEYQLANVYFGRGAFSQAREHALHTLSLLPDTPSRTLASLYNSLGLIEMEMGQDEVCEKYFWKALSLWDTLKDYNEMARCYLNLGALFARQNCLEEAKSCYQSCIAALGNTVSDVDRLKAVNGLGTIHYLSQEFEEAESVFRQGVEEVKHLNGMYHLRGSLTHNLGNTLLALGRLEAARVQLDQAITLWLQANDNLQRANTIGTLAEVYEADEVWETAVATYDQALELLAHYPDHPWAQRLRQNFVQAKQKCAEQLTP